MPRQMPNSPKLSDTQLVMLSSAAARDDGALLPWPKSLKAEGATHCKAIKKLLKLTLVEERPVPLGAEIWRRDDTKRALGLYLTARGRSAVGVPAGEELVIVLSPPKRNGKTRAAAQASKKANAPAAIPVPRHPPSGPSKQDKVLKLLTRKTGVSLVDVCAETGWQAHSVRGFLSGTVKNKLGLALQSDKGRDGVRRYRIVGKDDAIKPSPRSASQARNE